MNIKRHLPTMRRALSKVERAMWDEPQAQEVRVD
jgi:hypothetical protein